MRHGSFGVSEHIFEIEFCTRISATAVIGVASNKPMLHGEYAEEQVARRGMQRPGVVLLC
ncbi:MAG: hypothetical protein ACR2MW_05195 [Chthoniobacterales bacterium]